MGEPPVTSQGAFLRSTLSGAATGAIAAPYLMLPQLHLWSSFLVLAIVYALIGATADTVTTLHPCGRPRSRARLPRGSAVAPPVSTPDPG